MPTGIEEALIIGGASLLGSGLTTAGNIGMTSAANQQNLDLYKMQMEYNKPINQIKRLEEAGLNPALMYKGGPGALIAGTPPKMEHANMSDIDPMRDISAYQQVKVANKQLELLDAQVKSAKADAQIKQHDADVITAGPAKSGDPWYFREPAKFLSKYTDPLFDRIGDVLSQPWPEWLSPGYTGYKGDKGPKPDYGKARYKYEKGE